MKRVIWIGVVLIGMVAVGLVNVGWYRSTRLSKMRSMPYKVNITQAVMENTEFRRVLFTGEKMQLVVMNIPPGGEVGEETHTHVEQLFLFQSGAGEVTLDGVKSLVGPGDVVIVTPGIKHNFVNTGLEPLKIITTYAPPNHIDGRIHHTKADADADDADEAFGQAR